MSATKFYPMGYKFFFFRLQKHLRSDHCQSQTLHTTDQNCIRIPINLNFFISSSVLTVMENPLPYSYLEY